MKPIILVAILSLLAFTSVAKETSVSSFIENKGQIIDQNRQPNNQVRYLYNGKGLNVQLRKTGFSYDVWKDTPAERQTTPIIGSTKLPDPIIRQFHRVDIEFVDANANITMQEEGTSVSYNNYYNEHGAFERIRSFSKVTYSNVWTDIDVVFEASESGSKYNIVLHPGADINEVRFRIKGAERIEQEGDGLQLTTSITNIHERVPYSYIVENGKLKNISVQMQPVGNDVYGFSTKEIIPANVKLVIDPVPDIVWANYYGGGSGEEINAAANDAGGNTYVTGWTASGTNIATTGAFQSALGGVFDVVIAKFNANGTINWSTYYGSGSTNIGFGIAVDQSGQHVYVAGGANSPSTFGTIGAHQPTCAGQADAFLCEFNGNGLRVWSTYYGGTALDNGASVVLDNIGNIYLAGSSASTSGIATPGTHQTIVSGDNGFLAKFTTAGQRIWGTYYGGAGQTTAYIGGVIADSVYLVGSTDATAGIATIGTYQPTLSGAKDAFIAKFDTSGLRYWGTYYGGVLAEEVNSGTIDVNGNIYMVGRTTSVSGISTSGAMQPIFGGKSDGFISKFDRLGNLAWGTYYGGSEYDDLKDIVFQNDEIVVVGLTRSPNNIATTGTLDPTPIANANIQRAIISFLSPDGNRQLGTYFGKIATSAQGNLANTIAANTNNRFIVGGVSEGMPLGGLNTPYQGTLGGGSFDAFLLAITKCPANFATASSNSPVKLGNVINLTATGGISFAWSHNSGFTSTQQNPVRTNAVYNDSGLYTVIVEDQYNCIDTVQTRVQIISPDGIEDIQKGAVIRIFPNPSRDYIYIDALDEKIELFRIADLSGRVVKELKNDKNTLTVPVNGLPEGTYLYQVITASGIVHTGTIALVH